jgi:hypothetical protein
MGRAGLSQWLCRRAAVAGPAGPLACPLRCGTGNAANPEATMTLSVKDPILPIDIADIHLLKNGKIIFLTGHEGERLVLKTELGTSAGNVKNAKAVMKAIDPSIKTKIVTQEEIDLLLDWAKQVIAIENSFANLPQDEKNKKGPGLNPLRKEALQSLIDALTEWHNSMKNTDNINDAMNPLIKINYVDVKDIKDEVEKRLNEEKKDKSGVRAFVRALNGPGGFETLGKIIAADLVNDNDDRFAVNGGSDVNIGGRSFSFKALVNPGNVFLNISNNGAKSISGLDFIAPGRMSNKDINAPLPIDHPIHHLTTKELRAKLATNVVADLELIVNPKRGRFSFNKLDSNAAKRLQAGMIEGAQLIAAEFDRKYRSKPEKGNRWTDGVRERYELLQKVR